MNSALDSKAEIADQETRRQRQYVVHWRVINKARYFQYIEKYMLAEFVDMIRNEFDQYEEGHGSPLSFEEAEAAVRSANVQYAGAMEHFTLPFVPEPEPTWPRHQDGSRKMLTEMAIEEQRSTMQPCIEKMLLEGKIPQSAKPAFEDLGWLPAQQPCEHDYSYAVYPAGKCRKCGACD